MKTVLLATAAISLVKGLCKAVIISPATRLWLPEFWMPEGQVALNSSCLIAFGIVWRRSLKEETLRNSSYGQQMLELTFAGESWASENTGQRIVRRQRRYAKLIKL